jgi:hypothetical protein
MKSLKVGKNISASVENVTTSGIWLFAGGREYFLSYSEFPFFKDQTINEIHEVQLLHGSHLYWPKLDVDLELDNLENPGNYPLKSKMTLKPIPPKKNKRAVLRKNNN